MKDTVGFRIKICGVRSLADVEMARVAGADAIGLNFYPPSVRYVTDAVAEELAAAARRAGLVTVGVFVNESESEVRRRRERCSLQIVQLHGDETLEEARRLLQDGIQVLRAVRLATGPIEAATLDRRVRPWIEAGCGLLLDADGGSQVGGSGTALDWNSLRQWQEISDGAAWVLAGGLNPKNVVQAVTASGAVAVDVASGVEQPRGSKSPELVRDFVLQALRGLAGSPEMGRAE